MIKQKGRQQKKRVAAVKIFTLSDRDLYNLTFIGNNSKSMHESSHNILQRNWKFMI